MLHLRIPLTDLPDVSGLHSVVMDFCEKIDENTVVPEHLPLLIEFLCSCRLARQLQQIREAGRNSLSSVDPLSRGGANNGNSTRESEGTQSTEAGHPLVVSSSSGSANC